MTYPHPVTVTRPVGAAGPVSDDGWGAGAPGVETLYDYPSQVQDGQTARKALADAAGVSEEASVVVYVHPSQAEAFARIQTGDAVATPLGTGTVAGVMHADGAFAVTLTQRAASPPAPLLIA